MDLLCCSSTFNSYQNSPWRICVRHKATYQIIIECWFPILCLFESPAYSYLSRLHSKYMVYVQSSCYGCQKGKDSESPSKASSPLQTRIVSRIALSLGSFFEEMENVYFCPISSNGCVVSKR